MATDFDEIEQLREVIDALRANNGKLLRLLRKRLSKDTPPEAKKLVETMVISLSYGTCEGTSRQKVWLSWKGYLSPVTSPGWPKEARSCADRVPCLERQMDGIARAKIEE